MSKHNLSPKNNLQPESRIYTNDPHSNIVYKIDDLLNAYRMMMMGVDGVLV